MNNPFNFFNLSDFRKWIHNHKEDKLKSDTWIGKFIKIRNNVENFEEKIQIEVGDEEEIITEFLNHGGKAVEQDKNKIMIEVASGALFATKDF